MSNFEAIGVALLAVGVSFLSGVAVERKRKENSTVFDATGDDTVYELIESSRTKDVFSMRYANYLYDLYDLDIVADAYYINVLYYWNILSDEDMLSYASEYFPIVKYKELLENKYGEYATSSILLSLCNNLLTKNTGDTYHNYNNLQEAVVWEKIIPFLEVQNSKAEKEKDFKMYLTTFKLLYTFYAQSDKAYFIKAKQSFEDKLANSKLHFPDKDEEDYAKLTEILKTIESEYSI